MNWHQYCSRIPWVTIYETCMKNFYQSVQKHWKIGKREITTRQSLAQFFALQVTAKKRFLSIVLPSVSSFSNGPNMVYKHPWQTSHITISLLSSYPSISKIFFHMATLNIYSCGKLALIKVWIFFHIASTRNYYSRSYFPFFDLKVFYCKFYIDIGKIPPNIATKKIFSNT